MLKTKLIAAVFMLAGLGACNTVATTKNISPDVQAPIQSTKSASWRVRDVRVLVPDSLSVSEANLYLPPSDIVWREDPFGDRRAQVATIMDTALTDGVKGFHGYQPVDLDVQITRFHALSQKARATVGGRHTILFLMTIRDAETGLTLVGPVEVEANLAAFGGQKAIDAAMQGETQKVRITRHVADVIKQQLAVYTN